MAYPKSEMRTGAEQRIAGARQRLDAALAAPAARADGSDILAEAMRTNDSTTARAEVARLAPLHPEIGEAWKALGEAIKFYGFALLTDVDKGSEGSSAS
jgi:hypothetical protein